MTVIGLMLAWLGLGVFVWAMVGLIWPALAWLPNRASAVKLGAMSVAILVLGAVIRPPTEAELAERRAAAEAREDARVERAAAEAAREAEEAAAAAAAERERAEAAEHERAAQQRAEREREAAAELLTQDEVFEKLTVISNPAWGDHDRMLTRYRYVLPRIAENCADVPNAERAGDMIVVVGNNLHEAGLSDGYPE